MIREAVAVLIPACAIGVFILPRRPVETAGLKTRRYGARPVIAAGTLALCLGIGFSSLTSTALIILGMAPTTRGFVLADAAIWASVGALGWWLRRTQSQKPRAQSPEPRAESLPRAESREPRAEWILPAAFGMTAMVALASVVASYLASPHGEWDAWAIWNQHARFLFRGGGSDAWRGFFTIGWSQPDYPLLLPASVARVWAYAGDESTLGPALIALIFGMASVALVVSALDGRRAWIAGMLVLIASTFLAQVSSQCADVPVACFIVATLAVACGGVLQESPRTGALVAGATSAMAAWTKNEGLVFALLMLIVAVVVAVRRREGRQLWWGMAGGVPVLIAVVWFKVTLAPPSGLVEGQSLDVLVTRLMDLDRHLTVAALMARHVMRWSAPFAAAVFPLVGLAVAVVAVRGERAVRAMAVVVALMLVSYYLVYVTTPFDITWHVSTSIDRLLVQLWPALVLTVALGSRRLALGSRL